MTDTNENNHAGSPDGESEHREGGKPLVRRLRSSNARDHLTAEDFIPPVDPSLYLIEKTAQSSNTGNRRTSETFNHPIDPTPFLQVKGPPSLFMRVLGWLPGLLSLTIATRWILGLLVATATGREMLVDAASIFVAALWLLAFWKLRKIWQHEQIRRALRRPYRGGDC